MIFDKKPAESPEEFFTRVIGLKSSCGLTWKDVATVMNNATGESATANCWRKRAERLTSRFNQEEFTSRVEGEDPEFVEEYEDHSRKTYDSDMRSTVNSMYRRLSREDTIKEIASSYAKIMNEALMLDFTAIDKGECLENTSAILLLSDWHYGVEYSGAYNSYSPEIAKTRLVELEQKVLDRARRYNVTELHVVNLGDLIAGNIHLPIRINSRIDVITQIMEVSEILAEMLARFSKEFKIHYYSCIDNHSRIDPNKKDALQLENLTRITDWYLRERVPAICYHENEYGLDIADLEVRGYNFLAVHGDLDKKKDLVYKLGSYTMYHWNGIFSAHLHHFYAEEINDTLHISNGSVMGEDEYSHQLRLTGDPSQTMIIVSDTNPYEAIYKIDLKYESSFALD